jgi:deoxyhypusine synthase
MLRHRYVHKSLPTRRTKTREPVSRGKINEKAKRIMIEGDATVIMPIMTSVLIDRLSKKAKA